MLLPPMPDPLYPTYVYTHSAKFPAFWTTSHVSLLDVDPVMVMVTGAKGAAAWFSVMLVYGNMAVLALFPSVTAAGMTWMITGGMVAGYAHTAAGHDAIHPLLHLTNIRYQLCLYDVPARTFLPP